MSPKQLQCALCDDYVINGPIQCSCGDRLCTPCFTTLSNNAVKFTCKKCNSEVSVSQCFKDRAATMELKKATLQCINTGCQWTGSSEVYQRHRENCPFGKVPCSYAKYGCKETAARSDISVHEAKCHFVPATCQWCKKVIVNDKSHLEDECDSIPLVCTNGCGASVPRREMQHHLKNICTHVPRECEYKDEGCPFIGHGKDLEEHYSNNMKNHLQLTKSSFKKMEKSMDSKIMMLAQQISDLKSEINHVHREISVKLQPVAAAMGKAETAIQNLQEGFSELALMVQTLQATSYNGTFIWKIPEIQRRRHEAKIGKTISLYSAPFYTSRQGYKACLRLYMDGDGCGKTTHLSFFLTLMKGEYDALLQWPFRHTVTLTLLDQDGAKNIAQSFKPEPTSSSFQRPKNEMNIASGCPMFAPLSVLNNSSYVKDDTMFLKCQMDTTNIKLP